MGKKTQEKADEAKKTNTPNETEMTPEEKAAAEAKFLERVRGLIGVARKKKNILEYQEISDYFADLQLNEDQFDKLLELLEQRPIEKITVADLCARADLNRTTFYNYYDSPRALLAQIEQELFEKIRLIFGI